MPRSDKLYIFFLDIQHSKDQDDRDEKFTLEKY